MASVQSPEYSLFAILHWFLTSNPIQVQEMTKKRTKMLAPFAVRNKNLFISSFLIFVLAFIILVIKNVFDFYFKKIGDFKCQS